MVPDPTARSYRALLRLPSMRRVVASLFLARTAQTTVRVALVLFSLAEFQSPSLAGMVAFASFFPGIIASPIAGALIDRLGAVRLIATDYLVACSATLAIGSLSLAGVLSPEGLIALAAVFSMTAPLSVSGLRSLLPTLVPRQLWERINAVDSNGLVVATMLGPLLASALLAGLGPARGMMALSIPYVIALLVNTGIDDPRRPAIPDGTILSGARAGLLYVWRNPTLRGLGASVATYTISNGVVAVTVPLIIVTHLGTSVIGVGIAFGLSGMAGFASVLFFGRFDSGGREWRMLVAPMLATAPVMAILVLPAGELGRTQPAVAFALVCVSLVLVGVLEGPLNIGMFTVRQRRTDPRWFGRAFAISMAVNAMGYPVGAALAGAIAEESLENAVVLGSFACVAAAVLAATLVPRQAGDLHWGEEVVSDEGLS